MKGFLKPITYFALGILYDKENPFYIITKNTVIKVIKCFLKNTENTFLKFN